MKNRKRVIMGIALLLGASLLVLFVFGAQLVFKIHQKMEFEDYVLIHLMIAVYKPWGKEAF